MDAGWVILDESDGWRLERADEPVPVEPDVTPLDTPAAADVSMHWVVQGWAQDVSRAIRSFERHAANRDVRFVVADLTGQPPGAFGAQVEVVPLDPGTGWAAAMNASLRRATGRTIVVLDGSIEATGDVFGALDGALAEPDVGLAGPFGIVTTDLREFAEIPGPGDCDAIEGYLMAMPREVLLAVGLFDEGFTWYRTADVEFSFRVKDRGSRTVIVPLPVSRHQHRMWANTSPVDRERWSKRNFYRFLDRFRDRWDLVLAPAPDDEKDPNSGR